MRLNSKHTAEDLERYIQMYLKDGISFKELSETFGLLLNASARHLISCIQKYMTNIKGFMVIVESRSISIII